MQEPLPGGAVLITVAAVAANVLESYLGGTLQGRAPWITNDVVNIIQTCTAAAAAAATAATYGYTVHSVAVQPTVGPGVHLSSMVQACRHTAQWQCTPQLNATFGSVL